MGKMKELQIELQQSKEKNRHNLGPDHWDAVIAMHKAMEEAEQAYYYERNTRKFVTFQK